MSAIVQTSARVYRYLVLCYPSEFRARYGDEMADTFEQQLAEVWQDRGLAGLSLAWSIASLELIRIALPGQVTRPGVAIPMLSALLAGAIWLPLVWALSNPLALFYWYHQVTSGMHH